MVTALQRACDELDLRIISPFRIMLDGKEINAAALVEDLGATKGMIIVSDSNEVWEMRDAIRAHGYGFSVLDESSDSEVFELSSYVEVFRDWGWACESKAAPDWIK